LTADDAAAARDKGNPVEAHRYLAEVQYRFNRRST
jgi:hypothetical protein